jgi:UDP-glucose:(heptosyl)LPS alpha-1,3-glucosyltransferase
MPQSLSRRHTFGCVDVRVAVITPFLDRSHGTERCIIEQLERVPPGLAAEIHIYAQRIEDLRNVIRYQAGVRAQPGSVVWHKVPSIPGPHLLRYIFWFFANRWQRRSDGKHRDLKYDLVYSPGINAADADAIAAHIVFHEFYRQVLPQLSLRKTALGGWPRLAHRKLYYRLIMSLENRIYTRPKVSLAAVSALLAGKMEKYFQCQNVRVIRHGVDTDELSVGKRLERRSSARENLGLRSGDFAFLLIGNDWKIKGLDALLGALRELHDPPWKLLVVGSDERDPYKKYLSESGMQDRVSFLQPSRDVMQFYAAADAYVGPSLEDSYGLPILEAMACGLPVVVSSRAGVSEIIRDGTDGMILRDPENVQELAGALRKLMSDPGFCRMLGEEAERTAREHGWDRNAQATWDWLSEVARQKKGEVAARS